LALTLVTHRAASRGALVIAAAGNEATTLPLFPAAVPSALAVGGVGQDIERRWEGAPARPEVGTNYGRWVDIAAPAEEVFLTRTTYSVPPIWDAERQCIDYTHGGPLPDAAARVMLGCYGKASGTSMATPMVTGAATLVKARFPHLRADQVATRLKQTATRLTPIGRN
jgi:subtilisin family serine protease